MHVCAHETHARKHACHTGRAVTCVSCICAPRSFEAPTRHAMRRHMWLYLDSRAFLGFPIHDEFFQNGGPPQRFDLRTHPGRERGCAWAQARRADASGDVSTSSEAHLSSQPQEECTRHGRFARAVRANEQVELWARIHLKIHESR